MTRRSLSLAITLALACCALTVAAETHPFNVHDLVAMERIGDPQPSPDGSVAAFVVTTMDLEANRGGRNLWLAATDGTSTDQAHRPHRVGLESALGGCTVALLPVDRSGSSQVWRIAVDGGEAEQVTDLPLDIEAFKVGPDARALYFGLKVFPECDRSISCTVERLQLEEAKKIDRDDLRSDLCPTLGFLEGRPPQPCLQVGTR